MKKNLQVSGLITWMQMTLKMLVILCALTCNAQQGNQPPLPQIDKICQDRNKPKVCFLKGNGHMYGFDDFSNIEKGKSYMALEKSLISPIYGYTYFQNVKNRHIYFDGHTSDLHFLMSGHTYPTVETRGSALASLWCSISGQGNIMATKPVENKELAKLAIDIYDRLNIKVLLVHVNLIENNGTNTISTITTSTASSKYTCFGQAVINVRGDEIIYNYHSTQLFNSNGLINNSILEDSVPSSFTTLCTDSSSYQYIQFEFSKIALYKENDNDPAQEVLGLSQPSGIYSFVFLCRDKNGGSPVFINRAYTHELAHNMGCADTKKTRFYKTLMYYKMDKDNPGEENIRYTNWRIIHNNVATKLGL
ncbi:MAG: hypothetical protein IKZ84_12835 [Victivallales bacterium]|nr:hypothetical protein [Victivallales bacterium]